MTTGQNLTDISSEDMSDINKQIKEFVEELPQNGYKNIRSLFENEEGFNALKEVFLFEHNRLFGVTTQNNIDPSDSMEVLKRLFVKSNNQVSEIQQNIAEIEKSIKSTKEQSEELRKGLKESAKTVLPKLLRVLFTKILYQILKKVEKEQLQGSGKDLNNLKDQFHRTINLFNEELNSLMDVYAKSINLSPKHDKQWIDESDYATIEELGIATPQATDDQKQQKTDSLSEEQIYATPEEVRWLKKEQKAKALAEKQVIRHQVVYNPPQYIQVSELPKSKPQKAQISSRQKPTIAPKPSQEAINKALNKKVAPPVPPKPQANKVSDLRSKFEPASQQSRGVLEIANKFEKPQKVSNNVAKNVNAQNIKTEVISLRQNSIAEPVKKFSADKAGSGKLNLNTQFIQDLNKKLSSPTTSPKQSPTSIKKTFGTVVENNQVQNEAPKEIKQSITPTIGIIPTPPPLPTQEDLRLAKPIPSQAKDRNNYTTTKPFDVKKQGVKMATVNPNQLDEAISNLKKPSSHLSQVERGSDNTRGR